MEKLPRLTPGSKIYQLFDYKKVVVEGKNDDFIITIEKKEKTARKRQNTV
ncbi:hypothetical protein [Calorimonas adulescens]|nr:hypothetical protein [Calorimonas adulescens]MDI6601230.1 hypothetical protein [Thermoanaerobacteraceae bacterium]